MAALSVASVSPSSAKKAHTNSARSSLRAVGVGGVAAEETHNGVIQPMDVKPDLRRHDEKSST